MQDKDRYEILDGLRGIAAIAVMLFHLSVFGLHIAPHGYLAVDFFFMLSGFVLAHAYEDKLLSSMSFASFFQLRLIRIMPLSILGLIAGSFYFILRSYNQSQPAYSIEDIIGSTIINFFLLPKLWITAAPTDTAFPTNTPLWSLSLEMFINLIWASFLFKLSRNILSVVVAGSALSLCILVYLYGTADLGATLPTYIGGVGRVTFGFFAGVLIWKHRNKAFGSPLYAALSAIILAAVLLLPQHGPFLDIALILLAFPLVIIFAIHSRYRSEHALFRLVGQISFPLYATHAPILMAAAGLAKAYKIEGQPYLLATIAVVLSVAFAYLIDRTYDRHVRRLLTQMAAKRTIANNRKCEATFVQR